MHVKPAPKLKIRDPDLRDFLPETGRVVARYRLLAASPARW